MHAFSPKNALFCTFLQGGGATFWQAQNRGFGGPGCRASGPAQDQFFAPKKLPDGQRFCSTAKTLNDYVVLKYKMLSAVSVLTNAPNSTRYAVDGNDIRG
jgi:hypothetical protein